MNLAQNSWDQNNIGHLRDLLNETGAFPERGFEWYYWQRQIHQASRTFRGNGSSIASAAFSPDGQRVAAGVWDTGLVWDVSSGKELLSLKGHSLHISSVAFSPDGQRIVTGGGDKKAMVWDAATPLNCLTTLRGKRIARSPA
jgi:WD40 repeat protein